MSEKLLRHRNLGDPTAKRVLGRPVQPEAGCTRVLQLGKTWIDECYKNHSECRWSNDLSDDIDPILPSRVIDIGESELESPRLVLSNGRRGKWAALSHRWPTVKTTFSKTLKANMLDMQGGFSLLSLPATFQDAIKITRTLDLQFLWIDSLCIVQDSVEDWDSESGRMAEIFKNAYITIAAAATPTCLQGILVQREWVPPSWACRLGVISNNAPSEVFIDFCIDQKHKKTLKTKEDQVNYLSCRAWCFQETQISHRLLTFDRLQMTYTCLRHGLHEDREAVPAVAREYRNDFLPHFRGSFLGDIFELHDSLKVWYRVVADYTVRDLTFSSDKLAALSGIANVVGNYIKDDYYAGLWRKSLPQSLLWSPYNEEDLPNPGYTASKSPEYRAPS